MVEQNMKRKVKVWEIIVLVEFVTIIFLALYANYQSRALMAQGVYASSIEKVLVEKDKREKIVAAKLSNAMVLLQNAVNDLTLEKQATAINNVVPSDVPPEAPQMEIPQAEVPQAK